MAFDSEKLKENAIASIQLGVEDFQLSKKTVVEGGNPARALSSVRNLFAGMLLIFKYQISKQALSATDAESLIFEPPKDILPHPDPSNKGKIIWLPDGKFKTKTIDFIGVKNRFKTFNISVDWGAIERLQSERNHLEHLHPNSTNGAIADFIAALFPVLSGFITDELEEEPLALLGAAWQTMLDHHDFYEIQAAECETLWSSFAMPERMKPLVELIRCPDCGSTLIKPDEDNVEQYICVACGFPGLLFPTLECLLLENLGGFDPRDGECSPVDFCPCCSHKTFVVADGECYWCDHELEDRECDICGDGLGLSEQGNDGLCSYHYYQCSKDD